MSSSMRNGTLPSLVLPDQYTSLTTPLQADRQEVEGLKGQVSAAHKALKHEKDLMDQVKREAAAAAANAQKQVGNWEVWHGVGCGVGCWMNEVGLHRNCCAVRGGEGVEVLGECPRTTAGLVACRPRGGRCWPASRHAG